MVMKRQMHFVARCQYPGKEKFYLFATDFVIEDWSELETVGKAAVAAAWESISPHPAPDVIEYVPGMIYFVPDRD